MRVDIGFFDIVFITFRRSDPADDAIQAASAIVNARTVPAPGELFVLRDGTGLVVKRVEALTAQGTLRLASARPDYAPYERPADEVDVVGKVLWKVVRA